MSQSKQELPFAPAELVFALDIGTHSVVGIVGKEVNNVFSVLALEEKAHTQRAMVDGQIEDIDEVSRVAKEVTQTLENEISFRLQRVCVAAAGRTLVTQKGEWKKEIKDGTVIDEAIINEMETGAMQQAYEIMLEQATDKEQEFCCVGYSPLGYTLDDYKISKLNGHRGKKATVEVIATFLPQQVVDSLYRSMENIGLTVESLTLEPIAAMNAIIPNELRLLNLALVDIGAGTSDIAVSTGGAVSAYTMATIAGDELTEALVQEYLVDFNTAEKIKHGPQGGNDTLTFDDILGNEHTVDFKDIEKAISPVLDELSTVVSDKILEVNGKAPAAVFLVGGGSRAIGLCPRVADKLSLDITKVAVGSNNYMKKMISSQIDVYGPQFATPVGIALTAAQRRSKNSISVKVNGDKIALPADRTYQVIEVLGYCGYSHNKIMERSGKSITFNLNGEIKTIRGTPPIAASISINDTPAVLSSPVNANDNLEIVSAQPGIDAAPVLRDVLGEECIFNIYVDGKEMSIGTLATVNGKTADLQQSIMAGDKIETEAIDTLGAVCMMLGLNPTELTLFVNDDVAMPSQTLYAEDKVSWCKAAKNIRRDTQSVPPQGTYTANTTTGQDISVSLNGRTIVLTPKADGTEYLFLDLLNYVDIDLSRPQGAIVLTLNGRNAAYMAKIHSGDNIQIYWDKQGQ